eukprot:TRINITY_DN1184_c0_g1_i1.p1 TRINITY_DN1184_c0_g1~~TRINITY_DN1184_c0_g1_i1.p1  ORF type:complete len:475 (+),score=162.06 TRINITY_DN1184_c0_g1_i1:107-1531(+)
MSDTEDRVEDSPPARDSKGKGKGKGKGEGKDKDSSKGKDRDDSKNKPTDDDHDDSEHEPKVDKPETKKRKGRPAGSKKKKKKKTEDKPSDSAPTPVKKPPKPKKEGQLQRTNTMEKTTGEAEAYLARIDRIKTDKEKRDKEEGKVVVPKKVIPKDDKPKINKRTQKAFKKGERSSSRERTAVERFELDISSKEPKEIVFPDGKGETLEDIRAVRKSIEKCKSTHEGLTHLHYIMFGRKGQRGESLKSHILKWNGIYPTSRDDKEDFKLKVEKRFAGELRDMCEVLGISSVGTKADIVKTVSKFLIKPVDFTPEKSSTPKKKKKKSKKGKKKDDSSDSDSSSSDSDSGSGSESSESESEGEKKNKDNKRKGSGSDSEPDAKRQKTEKPKEGEGKPKPAAAAEGEGKPKPKEPTPPPVPEEAKEMPSDSKIIKKAKEIYKATPSVSSKDIIKQLTEHFKIDVSSKKTLIKDQRPAK